MLTLNVRSNLGKIVASVLLVSLFGCAAKYHTIRKGQGGENQNSQEGDAVPGAQAPSAQVEVVFEGKIVVKVKAGTTFVIRPSASTMDPDDRDRKDCLNPGIIKAAYTPGTEPERVSERADTGCESLAVKQSFIAPGYYEIGLTVTSNEQETAQAKITLEVIAADAPDSLTDGGFVVSADPLIAEVGQNIKFSGDCTQARHIGWDFRDQTTAEGAESIKSYNSPGQYVVLANCENEKNELLKGQVTVVVVPKKTETPAEPQQPVTPDSGSDTGVPATPPGTPVVPGDEPTPLKDPGTPATPPPPATPDDDGDKVPPKKPGTDNDDDKPVNHPGNPGQNPGQTPYQG